MTEVYLELCNTILLQKTRTRAHRREGSQALPSGQERLCPAHSVPALYSGWADLFSKGLEAGSIIRFLFQLLTSAPVM